jgi:hypothetical protein
MRHTESKRVRFDYLIEQIAIMFLSLGFGSYLFPSLQHVIDNCPKQGIWKSIVIELSTAWPSLLVAFALILTSIALLLKRRNNNEEIEEMKADIKEIKRLLIENQKQ